MDDFTALCNQYTPMIHSIIRQLSIYKNKEDYFQIGLIALWEAEEKFSAEKGSFLSFAYSMVKGRILNELKKEARFDSRFTPASDDLLNEVSAVFHDRPLEEEILLTYCESLTAKQAAWVLLSFKDNLTIQEIAKVTGSSASAVKSWRKSALNKIKADLSN
ncbi:sigma-70 family RNA polymerase sigma factor [Peribacillus sp. B-H-3]|uniref:sigma-70 family RNA polymerase sigma factor n=1 Tax=Peribacillus sp. B-H-3 TaxID=3400420 RepID=UPI003B01DE92